VTAFLGWRKDTSGLKTGLLRFCNDRGEAAGPFLRCQGTQCGVRPAERIDICLPGRLGSKIRTEENNHEISKDHKSSSAHQED